MQYGADRFNVQTLFGFVCSREDAHLEMVPQSAIIGSQPQHRAPSSSGSFSFRHQSSTCWRNVTLKCIKSQITQFDYNARDAYLQLLMFE